MRYINVSICYPYKMPYGEGIYTNAAIKMEVEKLKKISDNAGTIDFNGVNNVYIMLEKQGDDHGRIFQYGGYTPEKGMFVELIN